MEPQHERAIKKNRLELVRRLIVNEEFLSAMESKNVITRGLREEITTLPGRMKQAGKLLDLLHCRGKKSFPVFLKALEITDQDELLELLRESANSVPTRRPQRPAEHNVEQAAYGMEVDDIDMLVSNDYTNIDIDQITRLDPASSLIMDRRNNPRNYSMTNNPCGRLLVINNTQFHGSTDPCFPRVLLDDRDWSHIDAMNFNLFEEFGFEVDIKSNIAQKLLQDLIEEELETLKNGNYDCYMLVILSYGSQGQIVMTDGNLVSPDWIQQQFVGTRLQAHSNKPKLFLFHTDHISNQAWEATDATDGGEVFDTAMKKPPDLSDTADGKGRMETDAVCVARPPLPAEPSKEHEEANFFVINSKAYIKQQLNMPWANDGSIFIRLLIHVITKYANVDHFANMLQRAHALLNDIQKKFDGNNPRLFYSLVRQSTLKKDLYFYAKPADM